MNGLSHSSSGGWGDDNGDIVTVTIQYSTDFYSGHDLLTWM